MREKFVKLNNFVPRYTYNINLLCLLYQPILDNLAKSKQKEAAWQSACSSCALAPENEKLEIKFKNQN